MSITYRIGLVMVAILMILLPVLYCAVLVGVGWLTYWHAVTHVSWLQYRLTMAVYFGLIFSGVVLVLFMLKPLFARQGSRPPTYSLSTVEAPMLFKMISIISEKTGSVVPAEVELSCDVNASASFTDGFRGMMRNELTLTIGMSLVAGMTQKELAGVIAHELGHFRQSGAMRLSYLVSSVNNWFARVVYERDSWDDQLAETTESGSGMVVLVIAITRLCIALTRGILWIFMNLAHGISCYMGRQMEYDADLCRVKIAGIQAFETSAKRLRELAATEHLAWQRLAETYGLESLPQSIPAVIAGMRSTMPAKLAAELETHAKKEKTGLFDMHPSDAARLRYAKAHAAPGLPFKEEPASKLFRNFDALCRKVTENKYSTLPPMTAVRAARDAMRYV